MRIFLKIGLPWAFSLGFVFFIGLKLGKKEEVSPPLTSISSEAESTIRNKKENSAISPGLIPQNQTNPKNSSDTVKSPPLPPNLIRIMKGGGVLERMGSYLDALRSMDSSNVQDVVGAFEALPAGYGRHLEMKLLMRSWSAINPESALEYALQNLDEKSERRFGVSEALAGWATQDPDAALAWAKANNQKNSPEDNPYILGVIKGVAESDLDAANRRLLDLPSGNAKWQSATFLAQEYTKKSTGEAIAWANQFPNSDPRLRETILGQIGARVARQDLQATANWVEDMATEPASKRIMDNLLTQWVSQSPMDASNWVSEMEGNNAPDAARLGGVDPDEASGNSNLEQAYITYDFGNGFSATAGRMLTYMGFEAYDPTNMYQYSYAYDSGNNAVQAIYDAYDTGVSIDYGTDDFSIGVWSSAENSAGYELALAYTGIENLTAKAIFSDFSDQVGGPAYEKSTFWVSYQIGSLLLAAEVAEADMRDEADPSVPNYSIPQDVEGFLIMANYAFTDKAALTLRYSTEEQSNWDTDALNNDYNKFTISPSYVFTDNFSGLIEYSTYKDDVAGNTDPEDLLAAELIYTF